MATGELTLLKRQPVLPSPAGEPYRPQDYEQYREWATAEDGTRVPISLVCRKGTPRDGSAPCLLYGYGSYELSRDPGFSIPVLSLLDRGFVYALAHIRGGGEMGRSWYTDGKLLRKKNTFTDFIACARHLAAAGWTAADQDTQFYLCGPAGMVGDVRSFLTTVGVERRRVHSELFAVSAPGLQSTKK
jgi:oligopeptidase B